MEIVYYNEKIVRFIESLGEDYKSDVAKSLQTLKNFGHEIELSHSKSLGGGLFELRCLRSGARLFYIFKNNEAFILHVIIKKQSQIPKRDLDLAKKRQKMFD